MSKALKVARPSRSVFIHVLFDNESYLVFQAFCLVDKVVTCFISLKHGEGVEVRQDVDDV